MSVRTIQGGNTVDIEPGDWVDVDENFIAPDPHWGFSFEVASVPPGETYIMINVWNETEEEYEQSAFDLANVVKNYREVAQNVE